MAITYIGKECVLSSSVKKTQTRNSSNVKTSITGLSQAASASRSDSNVGKTVQLKRDLLPIAVKDKSTSMQRLVMKAKV